MFIVDKDTKQTKKIDEVSFKTLWLKERKDLQEWIANNPQILWEELLIIQKEFDWFSNTKERLDLLALDSDWNIVVIENKLDDSWSDVVWQAMKYAWYCSSLKKNEIKEIYQAYLTKTWRSNESAESNIQEFLNNKDFSEMQLNKDLSQRIILVAKEFRKEVTNTVIWARKFWMKISCIKITPYQSWDQLLIDTDQIIPGKDIQDIMISYDEKNHEDMQEQEHVNRAKVVRNKFWHEFIPEFNKKSDIFSWRTMDENTFSSDHWFSAWSWLSWIPYNFLIAKNYCWVELSISKTDAKDYNKKVYDYLYKNKDAIEQKFWDELIRERLDNKIMSRISYKLEWVSIFNEEDWSQIKKFLTENMIKFESALSWFIKSYRK